MTKWSCRSYVFEKDSTIPKIVLLSTRIWGDSFSSKESTLKLPFSKARMLNMKSSVVFLGSLISYCVSSTMHNICISICLSS
eukprot:07992_1